MFSRYASFNFSGVCVTRSLVLCVCFVDRCLSFFVWPLCCLSFNLRILITPLVSSNTFDFFSFHFINERFPNPILQCPSLYCHHVCDVMRFARLEKDVCRFSNIYLNTVTIVRETVRHHPFVLLHFYECPNSGPRVPSTSFIFVLSSCIEVDGSCC